MRLHLIDTLLHRARLFAMVDPYPWPDTSAANDLATAATLIQQTGYHRRDEELAMAQSWITST